MLAIVKIVMVEIVMVKIEMVKIGSWTKSSFVVGSKMYICQGISTPE